jgi:fermentation-respiration switch protein FrsA (DUF1100 family)
MEFVLWGLGLAVAVYVVAGAVMTKFQRRYQYFPGGERRTPEQAGVAEMHPVFASTDDGLDLEGWYAPATDPANLTVVYFHGNAGNVSVRGPHMRALLDAGLGVYLTGYRGYASNPGSPSEEGFYLDARAALNFVADKGAPPEKTVLYGESMGTGVAVQMAIERDVGAVILNAPFTSMPDVAAIRYWMYPVRRTMWDRYDSLSKIAEINAPLMVMHGTADQTIPVEMSRTLLAAASEPKVGLFIEGAGHDIFADRCAPEILAFLAQHVRD